MKHRRLLIIALLIASVVSQFALLPSFVSSAAAAALPLVDDFEAGLPAGYDGTIPIGFNTFADPSSTAAISTTDAAPAPTVPGHGSGNHVLKLDLNVVAWAGVTHAFENAGLNMWVTQDWSAYEGISFYLYGTGAGTELFVDVLDNRNPGSIKDDAERWTFAFKDDLSGWKLIQIPFASMTLATINGTLLEISPQGLSHDFTHPQRSPRGGIDLVTVMRLYDFDINLITEDTGRQVEQFETQIHPYAHIRRKDDGHFLARRCQP